MTKRQWIRAGFILAGALILNGCSRQVADRPATTTQVASPTTKMLARGQAGAFLSPMPAVR
jgi:PBP1b-binding outer membrane lipoprotein LpoB